MKESERAGHIIIYGLVIFLGCSWEGFLFLGTYPLLSVTSHP
jgi:hypothetical protein